MGTEVAWWNLHPLVCAGSEYGTRETVKAGFWPWFEPFFRQKCVKSFTALEVTQEQILSQSPTDATPLRWHLYVS